MERTTTHFVPGVLVARRRQVGQAGQKYLIFLGMLAGVLALDSQALARHFAYGQWLANGATLAYFVYVFRAAGPRLKRLMLIGIVVSLIGEICFSLILHMYEYRLKAIPLYVPLGHTILYAQVYTFARWPWVVRQAGRFKLAMSCLAAVYSLAWLGLHRDWYGFGCFVLFAGLLALNRNRHSQLFFLTMYLAVAYLELLGTSFGCWYWPVALLNRWPLISSGNPPSGISIFYMAFDITCFGVYLLLNPKQRQRFRKFRVQSSRLRVRDAGVGHSTISDVLRKGKE